MNSVPRVPFKATALVRQADGRWTVYCFTEPSLKKPSHKGTYFFKWQADLAAWVFRRWGSA